MKYLLAVDGSDQSLDATRAFEALTPAESLKILHVVSVPGIPYPALGADVAKDLAMTVESAMKEEGERALEQAESLLPLHPGSVFKQLEMGKPAECILKVAQDEEVDLVVMGARGLGTYSRADLWECLSPGDESCRLFNPFGEATDSENQQSAHSH